MRSERTAAHPRPRLPSGLFLIAAVLLMSVPFGAAHATPGGDYWPSITYDSVSNTFRAVIIGDDSTCGATSPITLQTTAGGTEVASSRQFLAAESNNSCEIDITTPSIAYLPLQNRSLTAWWTLQFDRLVTLNPSDGTAAILGDVGTLSTSANNVRGIAYDSGAKKAYGVDDGALHTIDLSTGIWTQIGTGFGGSFIGANGLVFNANNSLLYSVLYDGSIYSLASIDPATGVATQIGGSTDQPIALAYDDQANLFYIIDTSVSHLKTLAVTGGTTTPVGTGGSFSGFNGLVFVTGTHQLYGADTLGRLYTVNTSDASTSQVMAGAISLNPGLAYDPATSSFLAITQNVRFLAGQLVGPSGTLLTPGSLSESADFSSNLFITRPLWNTSTVQPGVAADMVNGRFLVVWTDSAPTHNERGVYAQLINGDGTLNGGQITVHTYATSQDVANARAAFDPDSQRYLVVWNDVSFDTVYGRFLDADGNLAGPGGTDSTQSFPVSDTGGFLQANPVAAYSHQTGHFLVAWEDSRNTPTEIWGQLIDSDGNRLGSADGAPDSDFMVAGQTDNHLAPSVAYDPVTGRFLVVWEDARTTASSGDPEIWGQYVAEDGTLIDTDAATNFLIATSSGTPRLRTPSVGANPYCRNFLVSASDQRIDPYVLTQAVVGTCAPNPGLLWPDATISPATASAGATVTFETTYVSDPGNTAPATAQLWIDVNGDGTYAGGTVVPASPPGGMQVPTGVAAALAGLWALWLLAAWRRPRLRPALAAASAGLAVVTGLVLVACSSGGGGGGGGNSTTGDAPEVYAMSKTSGDYLTGARYTVSVNVGSTGAKKFRFVFSDGTTDAIGDPAADHTLTVQ